MKIIIYILLISLNLYGGGVVWNDENINSHVQMNEDIFKAKIIDFELSVGFEEKKYSAEDYFKYLKVRDYIIGKIESLREYSSSQSFPFGESEILDERQKLIDEKTKVMREALIKVYEEELNKYPPLSGKVKAKLKIIKVYKGSKKENEINEIEFIVNPRIMCPDPIESTLDQKEAIWFHFNKNIKLINILSIEQENEVIKKLEQLNKKK